MAASTGRFSSLLLEGLDEYRRGNMQAAVRAWEEAYTLEPTNPRAREFLHSALERIYAQMGVQRQVPGPGATAPVLPTRPSQQPQPTPFSGDRGQQPPPPSPAASQQAAPFSGPAYSPAPFMARPGSSPPPRLAPDIRRPGGAAPYAAPQAAPRFAADPAAAPTSEASVLLGGARDLISQKDLGGALELLSKVLSQDPRNAQATKLREESEAELTQQLEARLGGLSQRPRVLLKPDEIRWLDLDPRAGFVLAQIDGAVSYEDLYDICGLPRLDTVRILAQLVNEKIIGHGKG